MGIALTQEELYKDMTKEQKANLGFSESFGSWNEFLDATERPSSMEEFNRASVVNTSDWSGCSLEEAKKLARYGWPEGSKKINKEASNFLRDISEKIVRPSWLYEVEAAGQLDVARFLDDEPECWLTLKERETVTQAVTIVVNVSTSGSVDKSVMEARGLIAANIAQALEFGGVKTRIILGEGIRGYGSGFGSGRDAEMYVTLKEFGELLDIDALAFAIIHPATLRRLFFAYEETWTPELRREFGIGSGYGQPHDISFQGDIYFGKMYGGEEYVQSPEAAAKYTRETLEKYGIKFTDQEVANDN